MKIIHQNIKKGEIKLKIENLDDLWYLSSIIDHGDLIRGKTLRKIKLGQDNERKQESEKRAVTLAIEVEKVEFHKTSDVLRALGKTAEAHDDVPKGVHHTFNLEVNSVIMIVKEKWLNFQIEKIKEASITKIPKILICILDRESVLFAKLEKYGYKLLSEFEGEVTKKDIETKEKGNFYSEIIKNLKEYDDRNNFDSIIVASPAFWKEELLKELKDGNLKKKIVQATCSSADENAIQEVIKRPEVEQVLKQERYAKETRLVDELLVRIAKDRPASYGIKEAELSAQAGAVEQLLVTDRLIQKYRQEERYEKLENIMKLAEQMKGSVTIVSSEHEGGKRLDGLGGIGAILRYRVS